MTLCLRTNPPTAMPLSLSVESKAQIAGADLYRFVIRRCPITTVKMPYDRVRSYDVRVFRSQQTKLIPLFKRDQTKCLQIFRYASSHERTNVQRHARRGKI